MDSRHDWLAESAENYIAYLFAKTGLEIFGAGKWAADVVLHNREKNRWWRVEVKSTDSKKKPMRKSVSKLKDKAEILAEVVMLHGKFTVKFFKLKDGKRYGRPMIDPDDEELKFFIHNS